MTSTRNKEELHSAVKNLVNKLVTADEFISQISDSIMELIGKKYDKEIENLKDNNLKLKIQVQDKQLKDILSKQESFERSRRSKNLILYGVIELQNENCMDTVLDIINSKLRLSINYRSLNNCYRLKSPDKNKIKPILIQMSTLHVKNLIFKQKKLLKGTGLVVREDLSPDMQALFKDAIQKVNKGGKVWSNNGIIFLKFHNRDSIMKIMKPTDLVSD